MFLSRAGRKNFLHISSSNFFHISASRLIGGAGSKNAELLKNFLKQRDTTTKGETPEEVSKNHSGLVKRLFDRTTGRDPAPEYNLESKHKIQPESHQRKFKRFEAGETYQPADFGTDQVKTYKKKSKKEDILKKTKCDLINSHKNTELLSQFISNNGKILPRTITGLSAKSQRKISKCIKRSRALALLPYMSKPFIVKQSVLIQYEQ